MNIKRNFSSFLLLLITAALCCFNTASGENPPVRSKNSPLGIPADTDIQIDRSHFALGYVSGVRQAVWVSYILRAGDLSRKKVRRKNVFKPDPLIVNPVHPRDYTRTGFDRGHLAPAADMSHCKTAMEQSFYMSNISPQLPGCNRGIWKRLEAQVRRWAAKEGELYIITGPVFAANPQNIGNTGIAIPTAFYKVIFDMTPPIKMIGFIIPNRSSRLPLASFAVPVDEVERITGMNFFERMDDLLENILEANCNFNAWK